MFGDVLVIGYVKHELDYNFKTHQRYYEYNHRLVRVQPKGTQYVCITQ